jgi:uncharacterized membrane protein YccC
MSLAPLLRQSLRLNPAGWRPAAATRCALVLGLVLLLGTLAGHPDWGVAAGLGAFLTGLASLSGVYRKRLNLMVQTCVLTSACALLGGLVGGSWPLAVLALTLGCLLFTLYGEVVPAAATVMLQATMTLLIVSSLQLPLSSVPGTGLLVLAGGAAQVLVLGVLWPLSPYQPERRAVSLTFGALSDFVQGWGTVASPQPSGRRQSSRQQWFRPPARAFPEYIPFRDAQAALGSVGPDTWRASHDELAALLQGAEDLRSLLISLGLRPWVHGQNEAARLFRRVLARATTSLERGVRRGQGFATLSSGALRAVRQAAQRAAPAGELHQTAGPLALTLKLLEQLNLPARSSAEDHRWSSAPTPGSARFWTLRPTPAQWRHGLRLALAVGLSDLLVRLLALPHGYWLPLTAAVVLRADYVTTVTRGAARLLGTGAAVLLGLVLGPAQFTPAAETLWSLVAAWLTYSLLQVGYVAYSVAITLYVIFSVSASGLSQGAVAEGRLLYTVLGGLVALLAFLIWPLWQSGSARERLKEVARKQQAYADALLTPGAWTPERAQRLEATRTAARAARQAAEGAVQATVAEPRWVDRSGLPSQAAQAQLALLNTTAARLLAVHLMLGPPAPAQAGQQGLTPAARAEVLAARQVAAEVVEGTERGGGHSELA